MHGNEAEKSKFDEMIGRLEDFWDEIIDKYVNETGYQRETRELIDPEERSNYGGVTLSMSDYYEAKMDYKFKEMVPKWHFDLVQLMESYKSDRTWQRGKWKAREMVHVLI